MAIIKKRQEHILSSILATDTGFEAICCVCMEFKSQAVCKYKIPHPLPKKGPLKSNISRVAIKKYCYMAEESRNTDKSHRICNECLNQIKGKKIPPKSQRDLFQLSKFPETFLKGLTEGKQSLNKLEQFALKLVIPFIRVANCERGNQMKVKGNLILISADVAHTLNKILPQEQNILPVSFKRKLSYDGHYIAEFVDKHKVALFFEWFKKNNPLFEEVERMEPNNPMNIDSFLDDWRADTEEVEKFSIPAKEVPFHEEYVDDEIDKFNEGEEQRDDHSEPVEKVEVWQQHDTVMCNKYVEDTEAVTVANRLASLIIHFEENGWLPKNVTDEINLDHMTDEIDDFNGEEVDQYIDDEVDDEVTTNEEILEAHPEEFLEPREAKGLTNDEAENVLAMSKEQRRKVIRKMLTISVAPGEKGKFVNWKDDVYIEEKAFPHLFPYGTGGYLSSCLASGKNMGFAVYCRNRVKSADPKFRKDQTYMFFLLLIKELMELKNCKSTYLRQARSTPGTTAGSMSRLRKESLDRYSRTFSVFKNMRGTTMYYEAAKKNLMATLRQRGSPTIFHTLSAAEYQWEGLLKSVYETVYGVPATDEVIANMSASEKNRLITENVVQSTLHFQKRIEKLLPKIIEPGFLEHSGSSEEVIEDGQETDSVNKEKKTPSYFYRIEFQARGAPHVHMLVWLTDKDGNAPPTLPNSDDENYEEKLKKFVEYHDKIIKCIIEEEDPVLRENLYKYQQHTCGFTCHKKKKKISIKAKEGHEHGENDDGKMVELLNIPICRFNYPRLPMDESTVLLGYTDQENEEVVKAAKKDYLAIRKYLIRQTYTPDKCKLEDQLNWQKLKKIDFKTFLNNVGMYSDVSKNLSELEQFVQAKTRYHEAIRSGIKGRASILPRRNLSNLFTNNFNTKVMSLHPANHDIQLCADPYAVAQYVVGYLSKNESGISVLLKKVEEECSNLSSIQKINKLASVLDKHREVSIQECVYRLLGLPMSKFSIRVKYLNTSKPDKRDGLLRQDLDNLDSDEPAFYPSPHQYYERLPEEWLIKNDTVEVKKSELCLADWWSEYDHFTTGEPTGVDAVLMKDKKGWFRRRSERAVLRYYLPFDDEVELARALCILFLPFENEVRDIHKKDPIKLLADNHDVIDKNRRKFEKNNLINELINNLEREQEEDEESDDENDDCLEEETTNMSDLIEQQEAYDKQKAREALPKDDTTNDYLDPIELRKYIASLNPQQQLIFDDIMERVTAGDLEDSHSTVTLQVKQELASPTFLSY